MVVVDAVFARGTGASRAIVQYYTVVERRSGVARRHASDTLVPLTFSIAFVSPFFEHLVIGEHHKRY